MFDLLTEEGQRDFAFAMGGLSIGLKLLGCQEVEAQRRRNGSPYLTAREAAEYLNVSYSTFRKKAVKIRRCPSTGRYRREELDDFAHSLRPKRKR